MSGYWDRGRVLRRLARLILMAQDRQFMPPLKQLARELDCCEKTVRRYLRALEEVGVPVRWRKVDAA